MEQLRKMGETIQKNGKTTEKNRKTKEKDGGTGHARGRLAPPEVDWASFQPVEYCYLHGHLWE